MISRGFRFYIELSIPSSDKGEPNTETINDQMGFLWCREPWYAIDKSDKLGGVEVELIEVDYFQGIKSRASIWATKSS
jgi:hypothetical protein